jgi:hypothetical protein
LTPAHEKIFQQKEVDIEQLQVATVSTGEIEGDVTVNW